MRSAKFILVVHTAMFVVFLTAALGGSVVVFFRPDLLSGLYLAGAFTLLGGVMLPMFLWYGDCPLTVWEKNALRSEGHIPYEGVCLPHYLRRLKIPVPLPVGPWITRGLVIAPIVIGCFVELTR